MDLAGSESAGASESRERRQEGSNINRSLLTLTHVIAKLGEQASMMRAGSDNPASLQHIPYRDSKLTRILRLALQGNSRISIVCTCTPWGGMADETLSARSYRLGSRDERNAERGRWWYAWRAIDALFVWQDWLVKRRGEWTGARHCERAYRAERARLHMPAEYQEQRSAG